MKFKQSYYAADGTFWEKEFGYCRQNNARLLGWAAVLLGAVLNLVLLRVNGEPVAVYGVCSAAAALFASHLAEQFAVAGKTRPSQTAYIASVLCGVLSYLFALAGA